MTKTEKNLWEAFSGESQANRKYLAFAEQAEKEGKPKIVRLFRAAAETVHAHAHLRALNAVKKTEENLKEAMSGEIHEFKTMYPPMIEAAKEEGNKAAQRSFEYANAVEEIHASLYKKAMDNIDSQEDMDYYVCPVCGFTCEN
ncbi:MAG: rubrerythrin family protein, partial [Deltaproteobacteria bacterium]|nr:rubrerythrin family protein [Deltaproteobacteria bacterium]